MTFIVGYKQPGINAIVSDLRISWEETDGCRTAMNTALKTGLFFPGCIFGRAGSAKYSREYICTFKESLHGYEDSSEGLWEVFESFVRSYSFSQHPQSRFQLLLSARWSGEPQFYLLDSSRGISQVSISNSHGFLTLGPLSVKKWLDRLISRDFAARLRRFEAFLTDEGDMALDIARAFSPYYLCLCLSELSLGEESTRLETSGVGGIFHFVFQTEKADWPQEPAVYILSTADRRSRSIYAWIYRVTCVQGGLHVEKHTPPGQDNKAPNGTVESRTLFDSAARLHVDINDETLRQKVQQELDSQPFYVFAGLGFSHRVERKHLAVLVSNVGQKSDVVDENGVLTPRFANVLIENFSAPPLK